MENNWKNHVLVLNIRLKNEIPSDWILFMQRCRLVWIQEVWVYLKLQGTHIGKERTDVKERSLFTGMNVISCDKREPSKRWELDFEENIETAWYRVECDIRK